MKWDAALWLNLIRRGVEMVEGDVVNGGDIGIGWEIGMRNGWK